MAGPVGWGLDGLGKRSERQNTGFHPPGSCDCYSAGLCLLLHRGGARRASGVVQVCGARVLPLQCRGGHILQGDFVSAAFLFALAVSLCATVVAVLLVTTWRDGDLVVAAV